jgi:predicted nuclease of predicted toxin-antitoxin system
LILRPYLDDCAFSHLLRQLLIQAGYEVTVPVDAGLTGAPDERHFTFARREGLTLITKNPDDFLASHARFPDHAGLLLIYRDNDQTATCLMRRSFAR